MIRHAVILIVLVLAGCAATRKTPLEKEPKPEPGVIRYKDRFYVPLNERNDLERRATNGDKNAAKQLANYWLLYRNDGVKGERWLRIAEEP
jgi:hypothetical protein